MAPRYFSEARLVIDAGEAGDPAGNSESTANQIQLLRSRDVAGAVVERFALADLAEFNRSLQDRSVAKGLLTMIGLTRNPSRSSVEERVLDAFAENLSILASGVSGQIAVGFTARDPRLAADLANAVADDYIALQRSQSFTTNAKLVTRAIAPVEPYFPRLGILTAASALLALLVGLAVWGLRAGAAGRSDRRKSIAPLLEVADMEAAADEDRWADDHSVRRMMPTT